MEPGVIGRIAAEAAAYYDAGEYDHALAAFSVLAEIHERREGPYSVTYLANLHECIRCMSELQLWSDNDPICRELHGKYVRTHGRGQTVTVDVAKHWAWTLLHLREYPPAVGIYVATADALWDTDPVQALALLAAAVAHRDKADPVAMVSGGATALIDTTRLRHTEEVLVTIEAFSDVVDDDDRADITIDGLLNVA